MTFATEFPEFDPATMPVIPEGFQDVSWHNDACPSFLNEAAKLIIFVDYADASKREYEGTARFNVIVWDDGATCGMDTDTVISTNIWDEVLAAIEARKG